MSDRIVPHNEAAENALKANAAARDARKAWEAARDELVAAALEHECEAG